MEGARGKGQGARAEPPVVVDARLLCTCPTPECVPAKGPPELAFAGRSNVGKSSLMNALLGRRQLVRTSNTPGCTRQLGFFEVRCRDGSELRFVDLPGYGYAARAKTERAAWARLVESYLAGRRALRAVVVLLDARRGLEADDRQLIEFVRAPRPATARPRVVLVATKIDKVARSRRRATIAQLRAAAGEAVIGASAASGEGTAEIWAVLRAAVAAG
ncbi:MAG: ribosome biogenesis GTP-binding protein YsxC [Deltaproteobacteria bacterium]|nr:ribosome biogenesis GTP-binding protein YsxC [Deltaproteobacteria bacterium]